MAMRLIAWNTLKAYGEQHHRAAVSLARLRVLIEAAAWATTDEVLAAASKAKVCGPSRVRFEVDGGNFRLIIAFNFARQIAFVKFVGTHAEYDRVDAATVNLF